MIETNYALAVDEINDANGSSIAGTTTIADAVVAQLAGSAARDVPGVFDMTASGFAQAFGDIAGRVTGQDQVDKGVVVRVGQIECIVDLNLVIDAAANVPELAQAVRRRVRDRIGAVTGLHVKEVNINVADIHLDVPAATAGDLR